MLMSNANATFFFFFCEQLLSTYLNIEKCSETAKEHFVHTISSVTSMRNFLCIKHVDFTLKIAGQFYQLQSNTAISFLRMEFNFGNFFLRSINVSGEESINLFKSSIFSTIFAL